MMVTEVRRCVCVCVWKSVEGLAGGKWPKGRVERIEKGRTSDRL